MTNVPDSVWEMPLGFDWSPAAVFAYFEAQWETADENEKCTLFDLAKGLYWVCVDWHGGMFSDLYRISCQLDYTPGCGERSPGSDDENDDYRTDEDETARYVYNEIQRVITAQLDGPG